MKNNVEIMLYFVSETNNSFVNFLLKSIPYKPKKFFKKGEKVHIQNKLGDRVYLKNLCKYSLLCECDTIDIEECILHVCKLFTTYINVINDIPFKEEVDITLTVKFNKKQDIKPFSLDKEVINFIYAVEGNFEMYV